MIHPFTAALDIQRRQWEAASDFVSASNQAPERTAQMATADVGQTESEVVYEENKLQLLHYKSRTDEQSSVPVLIVYALINRPYILDLQPNRSVIRTLLENGMDVYMIDWGEPSRLDHALTLDDYVNRYIENSVDVVRERSGQDAIHLLGYCMGGTMSAMYSALHPEKVKTLSLMAAGLDFSGDGGVLELWGEGEYYNPGAVTETFGNAPAEFLDVGFRLMDPVDNFLTKYLKLYENIGDEDFVENFARMERWLSDGIDVAGETYRQFLEDIYQDNLLMKNELYLDGEHVDIENIDMPVLQIVGTYDHLIPPEASIPFNDAIPSEDTEVMEAQVGHIGLSVSSKSHAELWPSVVEWYEARGETSLELTDITGIGPTYAELLNDAGIETVEELAEADPESLASEIDVGASRVKDWVSQAAESTE